MEELIERTVIARVVIPIELGDVDIVEVVDVEIVHAHDLLHGDLLLADGLDIDGHGVHGLLVHIDDIAVLIVGRHIDHGGVEDTLIAQSVILHLGLALALLGDVLAGTEDHVGAVVLVAAQHGEGGGVLAHLAAFLDGHSR